MTNLENKTKEELLALAEALQVLANKRKYNKKDMYFQDDGPNAREYYPKQMEFMRAGKSCKVRGFVGANGSGKTLWNALESYFHLSGNYPAWWDGAVFRKPINAWICAREAKALREGIQEQLFGDLSDIGTGIIPKADLLDDKGNIQTWAMSGTANCIGQCLIRHRDPSGNFDGYSKVEFKTYAQGWQEFQGPTRQWITLDEEPDDARIYAECLARTRPRDGGPQGHLIATFTPTQGRSLTYLAFVPGGIFPPKGYHEDNKNKYTVQVTWNDVPHLPEDWKKSQIKEWQLTDPTNIEARTTGVAAMGSGRIYTVMERDIVVQPFQIPDYFPRAYGLDFGWNRTAALWGAKDPSTKCIYLYAEYYGSKKAAYVHAQNIKEKGIWIKGAADPSGNNSNTLDGSKFIEVYTGLGLDLVAGDNVINAGIARALNLFESGQLKVFSTCFNFLQEYSSYCYDMNDANKPAKNQNDHLLDALRYLLSVFDYISSTEFDGLDYKTSRSNYNRDKLTGY